MNFYRRWGRFWFEFGVGIDPKPRPLTKQEEIARDIVQASLAPQPGRGLTGWVNATWTADAYTGITIPDDPEAHAVVSGFNSPANGASTEGQSFQFYEDPWPHKKHVGAQTATVTVEPLNLPCEITGDPS